jgi:hypothetical protein
VHAVWDHTSKNLSALLGVAMMRVIGRQYLESYFKKVYDPRDLIRPAGRPSSVAGSERRHGAGVLRASLSGLLRSRLVRRSAQLIATS